MKMKKPSNPKEMFVLKSDKESRMKTRSRGSPEGFRSFGEKIDGAGDDSRSSDARGKGGR